MIGIGEKVRRIKGSNSGMKIGDVGTVIMIKQVGKVPHFKIKEYSNGWHKAEYFERLDDMFINTYDAETNIKIETSIDWPKMVEKLRDAISHEENRRKHSKLDELKQQREELDKKIKEIEDNEVTELKVDEAQRELNQIVENDLLSISAFKKNRTITVVISNAVTNKTLGKGVAIAMPDDKFDEQIGIKLAYYRALQSYWKRKEHKTIQETF